MSLNITEPEVLNQYFPDADADFHNLVLEVIDQLVNLFPGATPVQIITLLSETDHNLITLIHGLAAFYQNNDKVTERISYLEEQLRAKENEITKLANQLKEIEPSPSPQLKVTPEKPVTLFEANEHGTALETLKHLIVASYNPRVYLLVKEIYRYWKQEMRMALRSEMHKRVGQDRIIAAFKEAFTQREKAVKTAGLIHQLIYQEKREGKIWVRPTEFGEQVMALDAHYYLPEAINHRFQLYSTHDKLNTTRIHLLNAMINAQHEFSNSTADKETLADACGIVPQNISIYVNEFVKMGVIKRIPVTMAVKRYYLRLHDQEFIRKCIDPKLAAGV
ncbi:MAG: hypothetical protein ACXAB7_20480 [Candidatus Kariarchaeaceae archaeon]